MRLLLDTPMALWWLTAHPRLSRSTRECMVSSSCTLSVASVWEVDLKQRLGKSPIEPSRFREEMRMAGATRLSVTAEHVLARVRKAVDAHRDPLDRLLVSVAQAESLVLLTADSPLLALKREDARLPVRQA